MSVGNPHTKEMVRVPSGALFQSLSNKVCREDVHSRLVGPAGASLRISHPRGSDHTVRFSGP
jgi:hypothetical protein